MLVGGKLHFPETFPKHSSAIIKTQSHFRTDAAAFPSSLSFTTLPCGF